MATLTAYSSHTFIGEELETISNLCRRPRLTQQELPSH